jgi:membrane associated rhomboid family serine protease
MFNLTPTVRTLLFMNIGFFLVQQNIPGLHLTQLGSLFPLGSPYFYAWQFVTYMFLHASWGHIFGNMFGLISFGPLLEQRWGAQRFLTFWLICGVGAGILYEGVRYYENNKMELAAAEFHRQPTDVGFAEFFRTNFPEATGYEVLARGLHQNPQNADYIDAANKAVDGVVEEVKNSPYAGMLGASGALFGLQSKPSTSYFFTPCTSYIVACTARPATVWRTLPIWVAYLLASSYSNFGNEDASNSIKLAFGTLPAHPASTAKNEYHSRYPGHVQPPR